jgi:dTDP-4-amino-4,6-dideoxygalactose transaminase
MRSAGVSTPFHYVPLHSSPAGRRLGRAGGLPVTDDIAERLVRIPLFYGIDKTATRVAETVKNFFVT